MTKDVLVEILKKELQATPLDKYADATVSELFKKAEAEEFGKGTPERYRLRQAERIVKTVNEELHRRYGKYANISCYKVKKRGLSYSLNVVSIYRTPQGHIYGSLPKPFTTVFFTTHSLERFEERLDPEFLEKIKFVSKKLNGVVPTGLDIMRQGFINGTREGVEFALKDGFIYLNIRQGALVLSQFGEVFVAKTFLLPNMLEPSLEWLSADYDKVGVDDPLDKQIKNFYFIKEPCFHTFALDIYDYKKF